MLKLYCSLAYYKMKARQAVSRTLHEQSGIDGLIVTLILVGIALIAGFAFRKTLVNTIGKMWNQLVVNGTKDTNKSQVVGSFEW